MRCYPRPAAASGAISRPGASAFFVSDGPISSNSGRNGGKNAGRNCVSALPQRAIADSDFLRILAGITFHHRCRSKGLCLRSPAQRLTRPLASATVGVFHSYRRSGRGYFAPRARERVSDGSLLSTATKVTKSAGRNCVSALPQRATVGCDFPHLLAGITFHHRCRAKGLCLRSPARGLTRPLASATAEIFRSCRRTPKPSPRVAHSLKPSP